MEDLKNTRPSKSTRVKLVGNTETAGACTGPAQVGTEFKKVLKVVTSFYYLNTQSFLVLYNNYYSDYLNT